MMPIELDEYDISILKSLFKDGRKSFRQVSRETGITTPTVKARFDRLVNVGFIKSVTPIIDIKPMPELQTEVQSQHQKKLKKGTKISLDCDFCQGSISGDL